MGETPMPLSEHGRHAFATSGLGIFEGIVPAAFFAICAFTLKTAIGEVAVGDIPTEKGA
jgi:hypothetical protein